MKKSLLLIAVIAATMSANAQGIWKSTGTEASIAAGTEITTGITDLKCVHSDGAGVVGKGDSGATDVTYNGVTWDNKAMIQGSSNGMYYAFLPAKSGVLDVAVKMGSGKKTFVLEVKDEVFTGIPATVGDLAALTGGFATGDLLVSVSNLPLVFDTHNQTTGTWDNSTAIQSTGGNVYMVMSFPVTAGKTYAVGCTGSKFMLRGLSFTTTTSANNIPASKATVVSTEYYNIAGAKLSKPCKGINIAKKTMSDGSVVTSKIVISNSIK